MGKAVLLTFFFVMTICLYNTSVRAESSPVSEGKTDETVSDEKISVKDSIDEDEEFEDVDVELETVFIKDPIRPYNRAIFGFNDKLYFYVMKPMYKGYNKVVPENARVSVRKFFSNIRTPVRFFNCIFQGKFKGAGTELARLVINTTVGLGGLFDPAKSQFHLEMQDEDFGQTLGKHGMGSNYFIEWPFLGPSNVRDTIGLVGDIALDPITLLGFFVSPFASTGARSYDTFNEVSIDKGEAYENIVEPAIDPYIAIQDAYTQNRIKKIKE
jgi:phospholipid-binding lipoprotein MlaA